LTRAQRLEVAQLAEELGVSQVTMRKDLDQLEKRGLIKREHGFAIIGSNDDLNNRLAYHYEEKRRIAQMAAQSVAPGETVMIESGSCCALLAEELVKTKRDVTIITNSAFITGRLRTHPSAKMILLGGNYQPESQVMVGPIVRLCAEQFFVDKLFVGTDGFTPQFGFTNSDMMRAEAVRAMGKQAKMRIVLTESQKFSSHGVVSLMRTADVYAVYTDNGIPEETEAFFEDNGVKVYKV
ncbi:MAG: DeoR/GlpR family DNA-binding transcription regulator, partial [Clostridia bacterium]